MKYFIEGVVLGLTTFLSCALTCFPVIAGIFSRNSQLKNIFIFLSGRFAGYITIAIIASIAGTILKPLFFLKYIINIIVGILLIIWGINGLKKIKSCVCSNKVKNYPVFITGILTGLSLCQPFIASILRVVEIGNIFYGIVYFTGFFIITSIIIIPSGLLSILVKIKEELKIFVSLLSCGFGGIFMLTSIFNLIQRVS